MMTNPVPEQQPGKFVPVTNYSGLPFMFVTGINFPHHRREGFVVIMHPGEA